VFGANHEEATPQDADRQGQSQAGREDQKQGREDRRVLMPSASERLEINSFLAKNGLGQLNDPGLVKQLAFLVHDHEHFRQLLTRCEPLLRKSMYDAMHAYLRFDPKPLDVYLSEAGMDAEQKQLPAYDEATGKLTEYKPPAIESLEYKAEKAIKDAAIEEKSQGHRLVVVCSKCTREAAFLGVTLVDATIKARRKGWVYQNLDGKESEICPKCPAARPTITKIGNA
jgi:hypothetical protein